MNHRGHVVNVLIDCSSGMMSFELFKVAVLFREFSDCALTIHEPREACQARGFEPAF